MSRRHIGAAVAVAVALTFPVPGLAARYHVGFERDADSASVRAAVEQATGNRAAELHGLHALAVDAEPGSLERIAGVDWVERARVRRLAFAPTDPLAPRQWYATANRAYDAWATPPPLAAVRVAVIDSGIDLGASRPRIAHRRREELRRRHGAGHARATGRSSPA